MEYIFLQIELILDNSDISAQIKKPIDISDNATFRMVWLNIDC